MLEVIGLIIFDYLLTFSCTFLVLYLASLLVVSFVPAQWRLSPSPLGIPLAAGIAVMLMFTPWEPFLTSVLSWGLSPVFSTGPDSIVVLHRTVLFAWLAGIVLCLAVFTRNALALFFVVRTSEEAAPDPVFTKALHTVVVRRQVNLRSSPAFRSAASWVLRDGYVLVPEDFATKYDDTERYAMYLHELTHIKRLDSCKCIAATVVAAVFWFNPVFLHALRRYKNHLEVACDRAVLRLGVDPATYASLVGRFIVERRKNTPALHFSSAYKDAARRFRYIFNDVSFLSVKGDRREAGRCLAVFVCWLFSFWPFQAITGQTPQRPATRLRGNLPMEKW